MATITRPAARLTPAERQQRVQHPLQQLRGYIRLYVGLEGLAVLALYLVLWFWIGLLLDFGFFKLFGVDWVQELPWAFRAVVLAALVVGLLVVVGGKVLFRLFREFRDAPLALVLERRFPKLLGDRLITAVELADVEQAARYGYSPAMIELTIQDAAERVDQIPVKQVFDWKRLRRFGLTIALATVGLYVLVAAGYAVFNLIAAGDAQMGRFYHRFNDVAGTWFERNVLLQNTIWPRRAHLELVGFPESGEMRVGRDAPPPGLRVRALKWVVGDRNTSEGWRALTWADLNPELLGEPVPENVVPAEWQPRDADLGLTLDEIELQLDKDPTHKTLSADSHSALRHVLEKLEERAALPQMSRRLRMLEIPETVFVVYKSASSRSEMSLQRQGDNEYAGVFSDLKETVRFTARGEDYYTPYRLITVVPPPSLLSLTRDEDRPAYLYYRIPQGGTVADLKGLKQQFRGLPISLTGEKSPVGVPAGTDIVLTAKSDKELQSVRALPPRKGAPEVKPEITLAADKVTFQTRFNNVRSLIDFVFEFTDTDNVVGLRHVEIKPIDDLPPQTELGPDVLRKNAQGFYLVTFSALIPFANTSKVIDDHGLESLEFAYVLKRLDPYSTERGGGTGFPLLSGVAQLAGGPQYQLSTSLYLVTQAREAKPATAEKKDEGPKMLPVARFVTNLSVRVPQEVPLNVATLKQQLTERPPEVQLLRDFQFDPADPASRFDLLPLKLQVDETREIQPRYQMQLWTIAMDNDIESGPHVGRSRETFTFLIVSEGELLTEIAKEEEALHIKLDDAVNRLREGRSKLEQINQSLAAIKKADDFGPASVRSEEIEQVLDRGLSVTTEVHRDYLRIQREMELNRVNAEFINRVKNNVCTPLDEAIRIDFVQTTERLAELRKGLDGVEADLERKAEQTRTAGAATAREMDALINRLTSVLESMQQIADIKILIKIATQIRDDEQKQYEEIQTLYKKLQEAIFKSAIEGSDKPPEKKDEKKP